MPIKVEPKVYFANERTFLAWLHTSVILLSLLLHLPIRIHIVRCMGSCYVQFRLRLYYTLFGNVRICDVFNFFTAGLLCLMNSKTKLLPTHSRYLDTYRAKMIQRHEPGPYEDLWGPTVLSLMLMMAILANFLLKIYSMN